MEESTVVPTVEDENEQLKRYLAILIFGWILMLLLAAIVLVLYGDALMDLFA